MLDFMKVVRAVGVEPTLLSEPDFESGASTNSTTPAGFTGLPRPQRQGEPARYGVLQPDASVAQPHLLRGRAVTIVIGARGRRGLCAGLAIG